MLRSLLKPDLKHQCLYLNSNCAVIFLHYQSTTQLGSVGITRRQQGSMGVWRTINALPEDLNTSTMFKILLDPANRKLLADMHQVDRTVFLSTSGKELTT